jgi:hypothetical protein
VTTRATLSTVSSGFTTLSWEQNTREPQSQPRASWTVIKAFGGSRSKTSSDTPSGDNLHHLFLAAKVVHHGVGDGRFDLCLAPDLITARLVQVRHSDRGGMSKRAEAA